MNAFIIIEIKNPNKPKTAIPIAEIFVTCSNSCFVGFFRVCQTRLHFIKKDFVLVPNVILERNIKGF